jgi:MFS family permease
VAYTLLILLTGTNLPTPLYHGYAERFGFSPLTVTLIFAAYAAALIPSLLVAGPLADAVGGRAVLIPAVALAALGSLAFALAEGTAWLYVARGLQGVALGAASGALTAALSTLEPQGRRHRAALVSTAASMGGLGLGPLLAGLIAQYGPAPRVSPFVMEIVLLAPAMAVVATLPASRSRTQWQPRRPQIPAHMRAVFAASAAPAFLAFAVMGLFLTLIPAYVATMARSGNLLLAGAAVALMLACSILAQCAGYQTPSTRAAASRPATAGRRPGAAGPDSRLRIPATAAGGDRGGRRRPGPGVPGRPDRGQSPCTVAASRRRHLHLLCGDLPRG